MTESTTRPPGRGTAPPGATGPRTTRRFWITLAAIGAAGLVVRLVHLFALDHDQLAGDGMGYFIVSQRAADGAWFVNALRDTPDALHPPVWTLILSVLAQLGLNEVTQFQVVASLIGTATIVVVGVVGRRLASDRAGLVAAAIAAVYPGLWMYERILLSETLLFLLIGVALLAVYAFIDRPTTARVVVLGVLCGLFALTRSEELLFAPVIVVPAVLGRRTVPLARRLGWLVLAGVVTVAAIAPWTIYNSGRFAEPVLLSNGSGQVLLIGNCDGAYEGPTVGWFDDGCLLPVAMRAGQVDQSELDRALRSEGLERARANVDRLPVVVLARIGRTFGFYAPFQQIDLEWELQNTGTLLPRSGLVLYWLMLPLAAYGAVVLRRRQVAIYPLLGFALIVLITTIVTLGESRYRAAAEVPLVILAAVAIDALVGLRRASTDPVEPSPAGGDRGTVVGDEEPPIPARAHEQVDR